MKSELRNRNMMKKGKKYIVPSSIPRNPLVAAAKLRAGAGSHKESRKSERQRAARDLQERLKNPADDAGFFIDSCGMN
jgi:hypothetical protein